ncbi:hypothetical protein SynBIOSU31_02940 [Synechococcus sp. BIOS-U3-1]|nr:hypothetical protein SynBIOSU31_02940 [Synechococcus sp. BIOS-U3-1]
MFWESDATLQLPMSQLRIESGSCLIITQEPNQGSALR